MKIDVKHVQKRGVSGWRYRRKVPLNLREALGKREILIPLGNSEAAALRAYAKAHALAEKLLKEAGRASVAGPVASGHTRMSPIELHQWAQRQLRAFQLDPEWGGVIDEHDREAIARDVIADGILSSYEVDSRGEPVGIGQKDAAVLRALALGARDEQPQPTIEDARKLYLKERVGDDEKKRKQLDLVFGFVDAALGQNRTIVSLKRADAKEVRDYMLDGRGAASVERYLNTVRRQGFWDN